MSEKMRENTEGIRYDIPPDLEQHVNITAIDKIYNWGRRSSLWPLMFGLACCGIEMICTAASRYDFARFGMEIMRPSPRQTDFMIISGTVTKKMILRLYACITRCRNRSMSWQWVPALLVEGHSKRVTTSSPGWTNMYQSMYISRDVLQPLRLYSTD